MDDLDRCYAAALRILNYRWNSTAELRRKLRAKGFEREAIESTLARLAQEKWLDDERFAGAYARTRAAKRIGPRRIAHELTSAGVSADIAREAIQLDEGQQREAATALCEKRMRLLARKHGAGYLDTAEGRNKLTAYLLNQGYDAALVRAVIKETRIAHH